MRKIAVSGQRSVVSLFLALVLGAISANAQYYIYGTDGTTTNPVARLKITGSAVASSVFTNINGVRWWILTVNDTGGAGGGGTTNLFGGFGTTGLVWSASATDTQKFLRGDGSWQTVSTTESDPVWAGVSNLYLKVAAVGSAAYSNASAFAGSGHNHDGQYVLSSGGTITGNTTILGSLSVAGTITNSVTVNIRTNYYIGTITNQLDVLLVETQIVPVVTLSYTNTVWTNTVVTQVQDSGSFIVGNGAELEATGATVRLPHLTCTPVGSAVATGTWDFSGATVSGLGTSSITTQNVQGIIAAYGAVTNSGSNVSGLTLTTSGGIVTLGGSIPAGVSNTSQLVNDSGFITNMQTSVSLNGGTVATTANVSTKADSNNTITVVINNTTNTSKIGVSSTFDLGTLAAVTGNVASANYAVYAGSAGYASNTITQVSLGNAAFVIPSGSTATRVGVDYDMTQTITNDSLRRRAQYIGEPWSTNMQLAVDSAAYSGTVTGSYLVMFSAVDGTTNWPTSFTTTSTVTATSGTLTWGTAINLPAGLYDIELRCNSASGRTNLFRNLLRRQAQ